ncbi:alpha/beta hydrolase [Desertivirga xinjiangensis]|uniref:alpha/beta hydrolase n=1 Tax=Desertivirga xinjiangensis TaxID=539206 RepID=UPI00210E360D|nr:alpha/beta hydrolase [Pedobacter xinjiangensis]
MKTFFLPALLLCCLQQTNAQSTLGLTGRRDTSFTSSSAYLKTLKQYPSISLVKEQASKSIKEIRNQVYCTIAGRELQIDAFLPVQKRKSKTPAILIVHGGGWRSGDRRQHIPLAQRLAAAGYASYTVEYRLSTEALYPAAVHDLKSALKWIRANAQKFNVDTAKIAVLGFSAGGELAAFLGVTACMSRFEGKDCKLPYSCSVQAVIDIDGTLSFVHPESGEGDDSKSTSAATYWFGYPKKDVQHIVEH